MKTTVYENVCRCVSTGVWVQVTMTNFEQLLQGCGSSMRHNLSIQCLWSILWSIESGGLISLLLFCTVRRLEYNTSYIRITWKATKRIDLPDGEDETIGQIVVGWRSLLPSQKSEGDTAPPLHLLWPLQIYSSLIARCEAKSLQGVSQIT